MPEQFLAIVVVLVFSIWLKAFPSQLSEEPGTTAHRALSHVWDVSQHAVLPVLALTLEHPRELEPDHARLALRGDATRTT